uniref:Uncharacterized protein n=1 Tax=Chromera velia CCMP2878 TaxID=1169474 RepID=A0A0G4I5H4_9ALVE|eukprot:Cvel_11109.t1-p1 / transcript=Cvel_11109.t1 / gene=Cvel_11109 / organism=Chromera_velia_CCMP2878 / gene_product=hypothetical protein / transcript_product=hypothetical protein / location=Cvel_scaffold687:47627-50116(+) / protein_length=479 / sequence_SO=supercontig / SO=protein_coding / is_pseudo=false
MRAFGGRTKETAAYADRVVKQLAEPDLISCPRPGCGLSFELAAEPSRRQKGGGLLFRCPSALSASAESADRSFTWDLAQKLGSGSTSGRYGRVREVEERESGHRPPTAGISIREQGCGKAFHWESAQAYKLDLPPGVDLERVIELRGLGRSGGDVTVHHVDCSGCAVQPVRGTLFRCVQCCVCFCSECEEKGKCREHVGEPLCEGHFFRIDTGTQQLSATLWQFCRGGVRLLPKARAWGRGAELTLFFLGVAVMGTAVVRVINDPSLLSKACLPLRVSARELLFWLLSILIEKVELLLCAAVDGTVQLFWTIGGLLSSAAADVWAVLVPVFPDVGGLLWWALEGFVSLVSFVVGETGGLLWKGGTVILSNWALILSKACVVLEWVAGSLIPQVVCLLWQGAAPALSAGWGVAETLIPQAAVMFWSGLGWLVSQVPPLSAKIGTFLLSSAGSVLSTTVDTLVIALATAGSVFSHAVGFFL